MFRIQLPALLLCASFLSLAPAAVASADPVGCRSLAGTVLAVTDPDYHQIWTKFQTDVPNLEPLLKARFTVTGSDPSCVIAHFSAHTRITDNYVVYQVRIDGVPMEGHLSGLIGYPTPVVFVAADDATIEQYSDPTKVTAYNFFQRVAPGNHVIEVFVAAGSGIDPLNPPSVGSPTLTIEYQ